MSLTAKILGIKPAWSDDPAPEVVIRRSGSVSSRRAYPAAVNDRFIPNRITSSGGVAMINVGDGNDIYIKPDEGVEAGSDESKDRIKRIKNIGGGAKVLLEQDEDTGEDGGPPLDNKLRSHKAKSGHLVSVEQKDEEIEHGTTGVGSGAEINIDGRIDTVNGIVSVLNEGRRGGTSSITFKSCPPASSPLYVLRWEKGHILNDADDIEIEVGCDGTGSSNSA